MYKNLKHTHSCLIKSPVGALSLYADNDHLVGIFYNETHSEGIPKTRNQNSPILKETIKQLENYFIGNLQNFDLPMKTNGTDFQKKVWRGLTKIPFGQTKSYGDLARSIRHPKAFRAVGTANGNNPISIIIPCHRVINSGGQLGGYGGGLDRKIFLLNLEKN